LTNPGSPARFHVDQIDHVELCVPDRNVAAQWYADVLGLVAIPQYAVWADDRSGPLMIGTKAGGTKLALFEGEPKGSQRAVGFHLVAFRVDSTSFAQFIASLPLLDLKDEKGRKVTRERVADHAMAYSVYFCDPWGYQFEITTYDYDDATIELNRISS